MLAFHFFWQVVKMLYQLLWFSIGLCSFAFNLFWFMCNVASASIPWCSLLLVILCVASKFIKLRSPDEKQLQALFSSTVTSESSSYWPIANRGAGYDAPENSRTAIEKCANRGYGKVLLDVGLTACGELVCANRSILEKAGLSGGISQHTLEELRKIDIAQLHPMGSQFENENVLTLTELMQLLEHNRITIFLLISDNSAQMLEKLKKFITENAQFTTRTIVVSRSPYAIYQLRKSHPNLICGLWTEKFLRLPKFIICTALTSIFGALFRNIIAPVVGISVVFLNKDEFNMHVADLWRNVGVHPIVYNVNSPNEKRYYQRTMKTQYLTDSLRSEPHLLKKA